MAKLKDGFYKQTAESVGSDLYVLLAGGGSKPLSDFATASASGDYVTLATSQTITGAKTFASTIYINSGNSISDENGNGVLGVKSKTWTGVPSDGTAISLGTLNNSLYFRSSGDNMYHYRNDKGTSYKVLDASNYNYYSPTLTGGGASGTWGINISGSASSAGSAGYAGYITSADTRNEDISPSTYGPSLRVQFKTNGKNSMSDGGDFYGIMHFRPYGSGGDFSGGYPHLLAFTENSNIWYRKATSSTNWGNWKKVAFTSDIPTVTNYYWANIKVSASSNAYTTPQFGGVTIYDGTNSCLYLKTTTAGSYAYLAAFNTGGQYGADVVLHSGSAMVLGAGESAASMYSNNVDSLQSSENLYLTADGAVKVFTNCDSIGSRKHLVTFSNDGYAYFGSYINIGGHEKNASSPTYVWGSNSSDNFLRSYQTSSLNVNRANYLSGHGVNPDNSHPGHGARVFYSWNIGSAGNATSGYSNGITIGSHPSDTAYGFQIVQNMLDDTLYVRRYNAGWQSWRAVSYTDHGHRITKLHRRDASDDYSLQHHWTGSYWYLRGYSGDSYHAGVQVAYANDAGNADTVDNLHASSFARWYGECQTDAEADDTTYTNTSDFLSVLHNRSGVFGTRFSAFRGSWYYVGNVNYNTGVGTLEMAGTAVLNISASTANDVHSKTLLFIEGQSGNLYSYVKQTDGYGATWSRYVKTTDKIANASWADGASTVTASDSNANSTYRMVWHSGNYLYGTGGIYCNPSTDYMYANSFNCGDWFRSSGTSGWYNPTNSCHVYPNATTTYGGLMLRGEKGGYTGFILGTSTNYMNLMDNGTDKGLYQEGKGWILYYNRSNNYVGIRTSSLSHPLTINGDSYTNGWSRAANGFYIESTGVHYTNQGNWGEIDMTASNEFLWGSSSADLYFNYRTVSRGTTVTNYIWNAGSSSSYATHTMGLTYFRGSGKYLRIGPQNSSHAHYETDATVSHWFNKTVQVNGNVEPYGNNTYDLGTTGTRWKTIYAYTMYAATAFYQSSDARLKTNIQNLSKDLLDRVYNINEVSFNWKESGREAFGYIALDYEAISKTFVDRQDDGTLTLDYTKALVAQIAALKLKIVNLEERLHSLERS